MDMLSWMYGQIQDDLANLETRLSVTSQKGERAESVGGFQSFAYVDRPLAADGGMQTDNFSYVDIIFIYNARKSGEGVGAGTGVPCYYDPLVDDYRRFEDNAIVSV